MFDVNITILNEYEIYRKKLLTLAVHTFKQDVSSCHEIQILIEQFVGDLWGIPNLKVDYLPHFTFGQAPK